MPQAARARGEHLRQAFHGWWTERYDRQVKLLALDSFRAEEVYVLSNASPHPLQLVPLDPRRKDLQLNMKALDAEGRRLVLLSSVEVRALTAEACAPAVPFLRARPGCPAPLRALLDEEDWVEALAERRHVDALVTPEGSEALERFFTDLVESFPEEPDPVQEASLLLADHLFGQAYGHYRPWVQLAQPVPPADGDVAQNVLVKYVVDGRPPTSAWEKMAEGGLGSIPFTVPFPVSEDSSSHLRFHPPEGMVFTRSVGVSPMPTEHSVDREHVQFYLSAKDAGALAADPDQPSLVLVKTTLGQTPSMRFVTAALFAVIALLPLVLVTERMLLARTGSVGDALAAAATWRGLLATMGTVTPEMVRDAASLSLPLAVGLFAASWDRPPVRAFAVTQLMLGVGLVLLWLLAALLPGTALVAIAVGCMLAAFNAYEGVAALGPLPVKPLPRSFIAPDSPSDPGA